VEPVYSMFHSTSPPARNRRKPDPLPSLRILLFREGGSPGSFPPLPSVPRPYSGVGVGRSKTTPPFFPPSPSLYRCGACSPACRKKRRKEGRNSASGSGAFFFFFRIPFTVSPFLLASTVGKGERKKREGPTPLFPFFFFFFFKRGTFFLPGAGGGVG